jgi:transposase-like protein
MTYDEMAVEIMIGPGSAKSRQAKLSKLAKQAKVEVEGRLPCPECGDEGPHDDNGATRRSQVSFCCNQCGTHFDLEPG